MKKIFSLLIVVAMVLTLSVTSFAATTGTATLKTIYTETENGITVDIYVNNVTNLTGLIHRVNLKNTEVTYVAASAKVAADLPSTWSATMDQQPGKLHLSVTTTSANTDGLNISSEKLIATYTMTKISSETTYTKDSFDYGTTSLKRCYYTINGTTDNEFASKDYDYVDNRSGGNTGSGWTETDGTTTVTVKFPTTAAEKAGAESTWTGSAENYEKKVAIFGKNETGATLKGATYDKASDTFTAGGYFVEYLGQKFYGIQDVPANASWAILIVAPKAN